MHKGQKPNSHVAQRPKALAMAMPRQGHDGHHVDRGGSRPGVMLGHATSMMLGVRPGVSSAGSRPQLISNQLEMKSIRNEIN